MISSSFELLCRFPSFVASRVLDGLLLDGRRGRKPTVVLPEPQRLAHFLHYRPDSAPEAT